MAGYDAVIESIRQAGRSAQSAADQARAVKPDTALTGLEAGMPGAKALGKLTAVRDRWAGKGAAWADSMNQTAQSFAAAAENYAGNEDAARRDLGQATQGSGGARPS